MLLLKMMMALLLLAKQGVRCDVAWSRDKRSDDTPALEAVVSGLSQQLTQMEAQLTALQSGHSQLEAKFTASQRQVYFFARHVENYFNVASGGTLIFNHVDVNQGTGYDTVTGTFTAPVSGLYVFFINCMSSSVDEDVGVLVEGGRVCGCYSYSSDSVFKQGAGQATVHMQAGQRAWVHLFRDSARDMRGGYWNTFVGFLVKPDV